MNSQTFKVMRFEIMRQLKKPAFWAATLLIPLLIGGIYLISFLSTKIVNQNPALDENTKAAITDEAGIFSKNTPYLIKGGKDEGLELIKNGEVNSIITSRKILPRLKRQSSTIFPRGLISLITTVIS